MNGLKILGKKIKEEYSANQQQRSRIDYGFEELIAPVRDLVADFYWILSEQQSFRYFEDYENKYDELIIETFKNLRLTRKGFITDYAKYVIADWGYFWGLKNKIALATKSFNETPLDIENQVDVYFCCVDGAFWEVYAKNKEILNKIRRTFPFSDPVVLTDKKY